jgi:tetratricopeptide (TPR) repeat protein
MRKCEVFTGRLKQSLKISEQVGDKRVEGATLNNISRIYHARGDYETALKHLNQSLAIFQEIGDKSGLILTLHNIAVINLKRENSEGFCKHEFEAYRIAVETNNAEGLLNVGSVLGKFLIDAGDIEKGKAMLRRAYEIGHAANLPGADKIKEMLAQQGEQVPGGRT